MGEGIFLFMFAVSSQVPEIFRPIGVNQYILVELMKIFLRCAEPKNEKHLLDSDLWLYIMNIN